MNKLSKFLIVLVSVMGIATIFTNVTFAVTPEPNLDKRLQYSTSASSKPLASPVARKQITKERLDQGKLNFCQKKEGNLKQRSEQLIRTVSSTKQKFDSIVERVTNYYITKGLPSGKSVPNYEALIADVNAKGALVENALVKAKSDLALFECDGEDPKGRMMAFNDDMKAIKETLKVYKESIRNLIVGVHGVTGETKSRTLPEVGEKQK